MKTKKVIKIKVPSRERFLKTLKLMGACDKAQTWAAQSKFRTTREIYEATWTLSQEDYKGENFVRIVSPGSYYDGERITPYNGECWIIWLFAHDNRPATREFDEFVYEYIHTSDNKALVQRYPWKRVRHMIREMVNQHVPPSASSTPPQS